MNNELSVKALQPDDLEAIARMNIQLQQDEGSRVMELEDAIQRLSRWLAGTYECCVFYLDQQVTGYVLYRPTDPDTEGHTGGVYIRQFYIVPEFRGLGWGRKAFSRFTEEVLPPQTYITLEALNANPTGRAFWKALGFQEYCVRYERPAK